MKHTETRYLWTQERLALGHIWTQAKATAVTYSQRSLATVTNSDSCKPCVKNSVKDGR